MRKIDFNENFSGFEDGEDILVDTGIIFALANTYDAWYNTVTNLFDKHVFNNSNALFLYVNPTIINEVTHLSEKPLEKYLEKHPNEVFTQEDINNVRDSIADKLKDLIENEILLVLDGNNESVLKQIELYKDLGSADAVNLSIANLYGISFLTVDNTIVRNVLANHEKVKNVRNLYYTTRKHRTY